MAYQKKTSETVSSETTEQKKLIRDDSDRERTPRKRVSMNSSTQKMQVDIPGYRTHVFNDEPGRIQWAQEAGYQFVSSEEIKDNRHQTITGGLGDGSNVRFAVNKSGETTYGYLMKKRIDWWEEDYYEDQKINDRVDEALQTNSISPVSNRYGDIKITHN